MGSKTSVRYVPGVGRLGGLALNDQAIGSKTEVVSGTRRGPAGVA